MTQVVTVSATTAAYAMEPLKPSQRANGSSAPYEQTRILHEEAVKITDKRVQALANLIKPPALALYFLNSGTPERQVSLKQVIEAYRSARD